MPLVNNPITETIFCHVPVHPYTSLLLISTNDLKFEIRDFVLKNHVTVYIVVASNNLKDLIRISSQSSHF